MPNPNSTAASIDMENTCVETLEKSIRRGLFGGFDRYYLNSIRKLGASCSVETRLKFYSLQCLREVGREIEDKYGEGCLLDLNDETVSILIDTAPGQYIPFEQVENSKKNRHIALEEFTSRAEALESI